MASSMPTLTDTGQQMYDSLAPIMQTDNPDFADAKNGFFGAILCGAFATMLDPVAAIVRDGADSNAPGWGSLFDLEYIAEVNPAWLTWVSQFLGDSQAVQAASTTAEKIAIIRQPQNLTRGRPSSIIAAIKPTLTGTQTVIISTYPTTAAWYDITITTLTSETSSAAVTANAGLSVMPAWMIPTFQTVTGGLYSELPIAHTSYTALHGAHSTYSDIPIHPSA